MILECDVCLIDINTMNDEDYCVSGIMMCACCHDALNYYHKQIGSNWYYETH